MEKVLKDVLPGVMAEKWAEYLLQGWHQTATLGNLYDDMSGTAEQVQGLIEKYGRDARLESLVSE